MIAKTKKMSELKKYECKKCENIFLSRAKGRALVCRNGLKKGCKSSRVSFLEIVHIKKHQIDVKTNNSIEKETTEKDVISSKKMIIDVKEEKKESFGFF